MVRFVKVAPAGAAPPPPEDAKPSGAKDIVSFAGRKLAAISQYINVAGTQASVDIDVEAPIISDEFIVSPCPAKLTPELVQKYLLLEQKIQFAIKDETKVKQHTFKSTEFFDPESIAPRWMIDPDSKGKSQWDQLIVMAVIYNAVTIPLSMYRVVDIGDDLYTGSLEYYSDLLDYFIDLLFLVDILLTFRTGYTDTKGIKVFDPWRIAGRYHRWFYADFVAIFPTWLFATNIEDRRVRDLLMLSKFVRLTRIIKVNRYFSKFDSTKRGNAIRIVKLISIFFFLVHLTASFWWFLGRWQGCDAQNEWTGGPWIYEYYAHSLKIDAECSDQLDLFNSDFGSRMSLSLFFAMASMMSVGFGDITPYTNTERYFSMFVQFLGAIASAWLIGIVSSILLQYDAANARYKQRVELLREFGRHFAVEPTVMARVFHHFNLLWEVKKGFDTREVLRDLPLQMQEDVAMAIIADLVKKTPMLSNIDASFTEVFAMGLQQQVCLPTISLIDEDEPCREIFIVARGVMEAVKHNHLIQLLSEFSVIGLGEVLHNQRAPCTVRGVTHCDLYSMQRAYLNETMVDFPEVAKQLKAESLISLTEMWTRIERVFPMYMPQDDKAKADIEVQDYSDSEKIKKKKRSKKVKTTAKPQKVPHTPSKVTAFEKLSKPAAVVASANKLLRLRASAALKGPSQFVLRNIEAQLALIIARLADVEAMLVEVLDLTDRINALTQFKMSVSPAFLQEKMFRSMSERLDDITRQLVRQQQTAVSDVVV